MRLSRFLERGEFGGLILCAFIAGIAVHSASPFWHASDVWMACGLAGCGFAVAASYPRRPYYQTAILVLVAIVGFWRFNLSVPQEGDGILPFMGQRTVYRGRVVSLSNAKTYPSAVIRVQMAGDGKIHGPGDMMVLRSRQKLEVGSGVSFVCTAKMPGTFPSNLERRRSLARKGVWAECLSADSILMTEEPYPYAPLTILARWRETLSLRISSVFPSDQAALLAGILYGEQDLSEQQRDLFQRSGLMHIVAVSGSNVTIVVGVILGFVLALGFTRRHAFWITSLGLLMFIGFVGFGASILRAAAMGWLAILARHIGRMVWTDRLLIVAAAALNLLNPWLLAFDPGFALSFLATWGLLAWTPLFEKRLSFLPNILSSRETLATTFGATIMTVPYLAWAFGRMSLAGLITNALALPFIPWTMLWGTAAAAWGTATGHELASWPSSGLLGLIIRIAHLADALPWLDLKVPYMEWAAMVGCYIMLWQLWRAIGGADRPGNEKAVVDSDVRLY